MSPRLVYNFASQNKMRGQLEYNVCVLFRPLSRTRPKARAIVSVSRTSLTRVGFIMVYLPRSISRILAHCCGGSTINWLWK